MFPLYTFQETVESGGIRGLDRVSNLDPEFKEAFEKSVEFDLDGDGQAGDLKGIPSPEDIFAWIYAILHSIGYRKRYEQQLKYDFPHVPLPKSIDLFRILTAAGYDLIALHLLESPRLDDLISTYTGSRNCVVRKVGWSDDTIWLNAEGVSASKGHRALKNGAFGFQGVPEKVWDFHIGSYQVLQRWLAYRKGRILTDEDIVHYSKIIVALNETIPIMTGIDEAIEAHGGWPEAFDRPTT